jgi:hypothetical protein
VLEAEVDRSEAAQARLFAFNPMLAEIELRKGDGAIATVGPLSDADELHRLMDGAQAVPIIDGRVLAPRSTSTRCRSQSLL